MSQKSARQRSLAPAPDHEQAQELLERRRDPARVMALTDGIFAIIMTLLVLDHSSAKTRCRRVFKNCLFARCVAQCRGFRDQFRVDGIVLGGTPRYVQPGAWCRSRAGLAQYPVYAASGFGSSRCRAPRRVQPRPTGPQNLRPAFRADSAYATRVMVLYRNKASPAHRACRPADVVDWCFHIDSPDSGLPHRHTRRRLCAVPESRHIRWCASALLHRDHLTAKVSPKGVT